MAREALLNPKQAQAQRQTTFKDILPRYEEQDVLNGCSIQPPPPPGSGSSGLQILALGLKPEGTRCPSVSQLHQMTDCRL